MSRVDMDVAPLDLDESARLSDPGAKLIHFMGEVPQGQISCQIAG
jgi:hypothetical protein